MTEEHITPPIGAAVPKGEPLEYVRQTTAEDVANPHPILAVWELTLACDLGCKHCGSRAGKAREGELTTEQCLDVVQQLSGVGVREVTLIGGEFYLRDDWTQIAQAFKDVGISVGVTTGARNLTDERIQQAIDCGIDSISISFDGLEQTHDALRGPKGSWRAAYEAAEKVAASPIRLASNTQINRLSMPELPALADLLVDLGCKAWQVQLTVPMGRAADRPDLLLQPYDFLELFPLMVWIKQTKLIPAGMAFFPSNNVGYFGVYEKILRWGGDRGTHWTGCNAGKYAVGIEADGKIKGCPSLPSADYTGGNFKNDRLSDVVDNSDKLRHLWHRTRDDLWGYCAECYYGDTCLAGCTWTSHTLFGRPGNTPYCVHRATELEKRGQRERIVKVEAAEGIPFDYGRYEIVTEPIPDAPEVPKIVDMALSDVTTLPIDAGSIWTKEQRKEKLKRQ